MSKNDEWRKLFDMKDSNAALAGIFETKAKMAQTPCKRHPDRFLVAVGPGDIGGMCETCAKEYSEKETNGKDHDRGTATRTDSPEPSCDQRVPGEEETGGDQGGD